VLSYRSYLVQQEAVRLSPSVNCSVRSSLQTVMLHCVLPLQCLNSTLEYVITTLAPFCYPVASFVKSLLSVSEPYEAQDHDYPSLSSRPNPRFPQLSRPLSPAVRENSQHPRSHPPLR